MPLFCPLPFTTSCFWKFSSSSDSMTTWEHDHFTDPGENETCFYKQQQPFRDLVGLKSAVKLLLKCLEGQEKVWEHFDLLLEPSYYLWRIVINRRMQALQEEQASETRRGVSPCISMSSWSAWSSTWGWMRSWQRADRDRINGKVML